MYAIEGMVTLDIPWIRVFDDRVALLAPPATELGDVKTCLYAWDCHAHSVITSGGDKRAM
jgi:hypothetical protein